MGSILGGMFLSMASNMIMIYLGIEFVSLLSYLLTAVKIKNAKAYEGSIKYLLFGGVSSGVLLFGLSYIYGITGSLELAVIAKSLRHLQGVEMYLVWSGFAFVLGGLSYKIAVVPFHSWCPDVYEGAATPVTTFFSVAPKVAGFAVILRFFNDLFALNQVLSHENLFLVMGIISAFTMTIGNMAALRQKNIKRLLAYSSIAHAGYVMAGFSAFSQTANQAVLFYLMAYLIMNSGAFLVAIAVGTRKEMANQEGMDFGAFAGLAYRGKSGAFWAIMMTIFLFSLTGIPPFVGFIGKYFIFAALLKKELYWLAIIGVLNTVISLYYYAQILKAMFFEKMDMEFDPEKMDDGILRRPIYSLLGIALGILTFIFGIFPSIINIP
jgi:NADH-quinone oxidoreductase subunit N